MSSRIKNVAIVDPFSSGRLLPEAFRSHGCYVFAIRSADKIPAGFVSSYRPDNFDKIIHYQGDFDALLQELRNLRTDIVVAGCETGVPLAELLNHRLGLATANSPDLAMARYNKAATYEALARAKVPIAKYVKASTPEEVRHFQEFLQEWPIVMKPASSSGTENVYFCRSPQEIDQAFPKIYRQLNDKFVPNDFVLAMQYLDGTEYAVQMVTSNGVHRVTDIFEYAREEVAGAATVYDYDLLIPCESNTARQLVDYAKEVLDACGVRYGPSHIEIRMTAAGPRLVELNSRLCGSGIPRLLKAATGQTQVEWTVLGYLYPEKFKENSESYSLVKQFGIVFLRSAGNSRLSLRQYERLKAVPGVTEIEFYFREGDLLPKTVNSATTLGMVAIYANDLVTLRESINAVQVMQKARDFEEPYHPKSNLDQNQL